MSIHINLSLRARILLSFLILTLGSLAFFISVVHDNSLEFKQHQEMRFYTKVSNQFYEHLLDHSLKYTDFINSLKKYKNIKSGEKYFLLEEKENIKYISTNNNKNDNVFKNIIKKINKNILESSVKDSKNNYYWIAKKLPSTINKNTHLILLYPLASSAKDEFYEIFGTPLIITSIILIWVIIWGAIILSSLVNKLQNQKKILTNQAVDIEKARDQALDANSAKSVFLANMSHEIRTPLTSIIGFAESCLDTDQSMQERSKATKTIIKSGKHLMHIINEILDLSKIEAGKLEIELKPMSVEEVLDEINQLVSIMAEEKGLTFGINYTYPLPEKIISDSLRLKQILINLCSNAIKFTQQGHVYLNVSYLPESASIIFEVIDTGIGMSAEEKENIFNSFEQADSSTTRRFGGSGLGLTLSKQLTEMLNGELSVESIVNKGSRFTVKLTIVEAENSRMLHDSAYKNTVEKQNELNTEIPKLKGNILVAEDNLDIQDLVKLLMKKVGVDLDVVENGQQAIELAIKSKYDLILMDIQMPVMDGLTAMKELQQQKYTQPVIAVTANAMQNDRDVYNAAGFSDFISKPINRKELYLLLTKYLKQRKTFESEKTVLTSNLLTDEPELIDLIDKFMTRLPVMQDAINKAYTDNKVEELSALIHQMKGVGGGYGYPMLTELCAKIEFQIENKDADNTKALIKEFNLLVEQIFAGSDENHKIAEQAQ